MHLRDPSLSAVPVVRISLARWRLRVYLSVECRRDRCDVHSSFVVAWRTSTMQFSSLLSRPRHHPFIAAAAAARRLSSITRLINVSRCRDPYNSNSTLRRLTVSLSQPVRLPHRVRSHAVRRADPTRRPASQPSRHQLQSRPAAAGWQVTSSLGGPYGSARPVVRCCFRSTNALRDER